MSAISRTAVMGAANAFIIMVMALPGYAAQYTDGLTGDPPGHQTAPQAYQGPTGPVIAGAPVDRPHNPYPAYGPYPRFARPDTGQYPQRIHRNEPATHKRFKNGSGGLYGGTLLGR